MSAVEGAVCFDTAIGACALSWGPAGISAIRIEAAALRPDEVADDAETPTVVREAIGLIQAHLRGEAVDLDRIPLDLSGVPVFHRRVYDVVRSIQPGSTMTYGEVAALAGSPGAARAVGQAMAHNPVPIVVPCHRVLAAGGRIGGFSSPGGVDTKRRMLAIERRAAGASDQAQLSLLADDVVRPTS